MKQSGGPTRGLEVRRALKRLGWTRPRADGGEGARCRGGRGEEAAKSARARNGAANATAEPSRNEQAWAPGPKPGAGSNRRGAATGSAEAEAGAVLERLVR